MQVQGQTQARHLNDNNPQRNRSVHSFLFMLALVALLGKHTCYCLSLQSQKRRLCLPAAPGSRRVLQREKSSVQFLSSSVFPVSCLVSYVWCLRHRVSQWPCACHPSTLQTCPVLWLQRLWLLELPPHCPHPATQQAHIIVSCVSNGARCPSSEAADLLHPQ